jgi:glycosyltransferase
MPDISVITVVKNACNTIEDCIASVLSQDHPAEYILVDGGSTDGTLDVIMPYRKHIARLVSEPDKGMYDGLNKGIRMATGEVIGFLHTDDLYASDSVLETVSRFFEEHNVDSCYGDLVYVDKKDPDKVVRYWKSCIYRNGLFKTGWMPPHPTFFVKRDIYEKYGYFNTDFKIAADYELMLRFIEKYKISTCYIPEVLVKMRMGGMSNRSLKNLFIKSSEDYKAWKINNLSGGIYTILLKNLCKLPQFINK